MGRPKVKKKTGRGQSQQGTYCLTLAMILSNASGVNTAIRRQIVRTVNETRLNQTLPVRNPL